MSTRSSIFYYDSPEKENRDVHLYHEMHDGQIHLEICDGSYSLVNVILTESLAKILTEAFQTAGNQHFGPAEVIR